MLEAALEYASRGWKIFPCVPGGKTPLTANGFKDATSDLAQVHAWWTRWPTANIARSLDGTNTFVVDVDPRNGGTKPELLPETLTTLTGGGGEHYYYSYDNSKLLDASEQAPRQFRKTFATGVDIKSEGGYVLLPPSVTSGGYKWHDSQVSPVLAPDWLLESVLKPHVEPKDLEFYDDPTDTRPGTEYNRTAKWEDILEPLGWKVVGRNQDGETFWCRPGKSEGISATTGYNGADVLYVFSSSTELEAGRAYTKFSALANLQYGGDFSAAAASLVDELSEAQQLNTIDVSNLPRNLVSTETKPNYEFKPAFPDGHFVTSFIDYVQKQTDAPSAYAEAGGLVLLSVAGYRCTAALAPYPGGLKNNLYVTLVGPTTRSRKSTVQRITTDIVRAVMPPATLPNRATTEALIKALSSRSGVPSLWAPDEFGVTLAEIYNRDFMKGLEEMLLTVYAGDDYEYQRVLDTVTIRSPHLSVLGAATPESISRAGTTALDSGLLPRFAIVYPSVMPDSKPVSEAPDLRVERQALISRLTKILTWSNTNRDITFEPGALLLLNAAESDLTGSSSARLPTMLYKVAALSAVGSERTKVDTSDAASAITVVQRWADGMSALVPQMYRHGTDQQFEQQLDYVLSEVVKAGGSLHRTVLANLINVKTSRLNEIESTLVDKGKIRVENSNGKTWHLL